MSKNTNETKTLVNRGIFDRRVSCGPQKQNRQVEPATEFADRVAPTKSVRTHVSSSRSLRGVQTVETGLECRRLEDVGSAALRASPGQAARANR